MRFVSIVGARPQFIKLAPVSHAVRKLHDEIIIHTGQHYDARMSDQFFEELAIPTPDYHLGIGSGPHGAQTGRMLEAIETVLQEIQPDGVLVYGDTNSTLAGALAATKLHIPVAHIEAGLRSFNRAMPEEINRVVTDHIASRLFCPTETARRYAAAEGLTYGVEVVGDVMCDIVRQVQPHLATHATTLLPSLNVQPQGYVLATVHRPSNTDDPEALARIAAALEDSAMPVIFPIHPRTRKLSAEYGIGWGARVQLLDPVGYLDMLTLEQFAWRIATDSGGMQKEAFLLGVPGVTMREDTEWPETLEGGWSVLVGNRRDAIVAALHRPPPTPLTTQPFGAGDAAPRIAQSLCDWPPKGEKRPS